MSTLEVEECISLMTRKLVGAVHRAESVRRVRLQKELLPERIQMRTHLNT